MKKTKGKRVIIGLVGEKFAGKDAAANYLVKKYGAFHARFSHILDDILNILYLPVSRRNEIDLGLGLRKIFGNGVLGKALMQRVKLSTAKFVVINGIRMDEMADAKKLGAKIVYITANKLIRYQRYLKRHEKVDDATMSFKEFLRQEKELTEIGIPKLGAKADYKVVNEGTLAELYGKMDVVVGKIAKP
ncbi:MAG: hypothetical protein M1383_03885 [Patescibacteria group bacterium]|nr:hypothetical protein [Patescibacteria group bacterium]